MCAEAKFTMYFELIEYWNTRTDLIGYVLSICVASEERNEYEFYSKPYYWLSTKLRIIRR